MFCVPEVLLTFALLAPPSPAAAGSLDDALAVAQKTEQVLEDLSQRVRPAVVTIRRFTRDEAWWTAARKGQAASGWRVVPENDLIHQGMRPSGGGSGFVVSETGYVLTLRRVVVDPVTQQAADLVDVDLGASHYTASVVSLEPTLDLAILKIKAPAAVPFLPWGDSRKVRAGQWAIAFGDPDGPERTLAPGVVVYEPSRECYQDEMSATYIQTSMQVSDGALGGPVVNLRGEVIGISIRRGDSGKRDSSAVESGSGYALPIELARYIFNSLLATGSTNSPWLGISIRGLSEEQRKQVPPVQGVVIDNVFDPSPAVVAGIQIGDILQSMNGEKITNVFDFQRVLYRLGSGTRVKLGLRRGTRTIEGTTTITIRPREATTR